MMALACQGVSKAFGTDEIIQNASFHIEENEKAAIVGINGAGKTTLLRIIMGDENEDIAESSRPARSLDDLDTYKSHGNSRDRRGRRNREEISGRGRGRKMRASEKVYEYISGGDRAMARLFLNIGKSQKVMPGDILGAVAGESGIPGRAVGSIDMYDGYTFVEVPDEYADMVIRSMKNVKIKGKNVHAERANERR